MQQGQLHRGAARTPYMHKRHSTARSCLLDTPAVELGSVSHPPGRECHPQASAVRPLVHHTLMQVLRLRLLALAAGMSLG
jgi:hypothetical protein